MRNLRMGESVLIIGESGSGKSTSIRNLDPSSTFIISVIGKPLPIKGFRNKYKHIDNWNDNKNNWYVSDNYQSILKCVDAVKKRDDIKVLIVDDFQYVMANEFMRRASESGWNKFSEISNHAWLIINEITNLRNDLVSFILCHSETDEYGLVKTKTIGKMLNEKISIEGMFTTVLHSMKNDSGYQFLTQHDGKHLAKSPMGLFDDEYVPNDLSLVLDKLASYYE